VNIIQMLETEEQRITNELSGVRGALTALAGNGSSPAPKHRTMSAAARAKIGRAVKARWAMKRAKAKK
jgi:hypothetical protein